MCEKRRHLVLNPKSQIDNPKSPNLERGSTELAEVRTPLAFD
jgi:hypothetical protein